MHYVVSLLLLLRRCYVVTCIQLELRYFAALCGEHVNPGSSPKLYHAARKQLSRNSLSLSLSLSLNMSLHNTLRIALRFQNHTVQIHTRIYTYTGKRMHKHPFAMCIRYMHAWAADAIRIGYMSGRGRFRPRLKLGEWRGHPARPEFIGQVLSLSISIQTYVMGAFAALRT